MAWHIKLWRVKSWGAIHTWGTKKECLTKKGLQRTTLDFCLFYIIIIVMDCHMPIDKMMSF
jgi:hypothetical protein